MSARDEKETRRKMKTREEIERAAREYFKGLDCPEPEEIAAFTIQQINEALEEAAKVADPVNKGNPNRNGRFVARSIRALKIQP